MKMQHDTEALLPLSVLTKVEELAIREQRPVREIMLDAVGLYLERYRHDKERLADASEQARAFEVWVHSHPHTPTLSDEAVRRENLIRDDH